MRASILVMLLLVLRVTAVAAAPATRATRTTAEAAATPTGATGADDDDAVEIAGARITVVGPPIAAVLAAAYAAAGLDRDPSGGWIRRARLAGLVPWLTVRTTRDTSWQDMQSEVGHGTTVEVRATWRLDRLVFDSHELQVAATEAARRRERRRLATRVIRSYFVWRRAAGQAVDDRVPARAAEAIAELDALTEGWFSDELARLRGAEPRRPGPR